ncbi:hypothetical protein ACHHYP_02726 [Achlya hypogyna]|uniref:Transmembrane protein n=1 Tax=Achlya hypogyna TaxID=1202772 RepID=A0A1V9Z5M6_ACHHY|nr:hypothetical protein ACHHYP_02726 [Achlya hypogyna]
MAAAWAGELELRLNANQLFLGVIGSGLWIYSLSQNDWLTQAPLSGGLFSIAINVPCDAYNANMTTSANVSGTWGDVCKYVAVNASSLECGLGNDTLLPPATTTYFATNTAHYVAMCARIDAHVQVAYLLIAATVFSLIALGIGTSFLLRDVLVSKYIAVLPSVLYFVSALFGLGASLHWHASFADAFPCTGSGYILAIVGTALLFGVAVAMVVTGCLPGLCAITGEPRPIAQQGFGLRIRRSCLWCSRSCRRRRDPLADGYHATV